MISDVRREPKPSLSLIRDDPLLAVKVPDQVRSFIVDVVRRIRDNG